MNGPLGLGVIGAGPVTQAIHLPALSTLSDRLRVVHILDVDEAIAAAVADRTGARSTTDLQVLLDDPAVDVVAICSLHRFHAEQVETAANAGSGRTPRRPALLHRGEREYVFAAATAGPRVTVAGVVSAAGRSPTKCARSPRSGSSTRACPRWGSPWAGSTRFFPVGSSTANAARKIHNESWSSMRGR